MSRIVLPAYERFDLALAGFDWQALQTLHERGLSAHTLPPRRLFERLLRLDLVAYNPQTRQHELTAKGNIPFGETCLAAFARIQDELIAARYADLERRLTSPVATAENRCRYQRDLQQYRAQLRRVHAASLYLLEVRHGGGTLYKVGVTTRDLTERITEIQANLAGHLPDVCITPVLSLANRGAVELYFKFRYRAARTPVGTLTEYFNFPDPQPVLADLTALGDRPLTAFDRELLAVEA